MTDCARAGELLTLYLEDELDEAVKGEVRSHLEVCEACRSALSDARAASALVRESLAYFEPGEDFEREVKARLSSGAPAPAPAPAQRSSRRRWAVASALLASAAAVVLVVTALTRSRGRAALLEGRLAGGASGLVEGRPYLTETRSAIELADGARALLAEGARFQVEPGALRLDSGSCYMARTAKAGPATGLATSRLTAELHGAAEVYLCAGTGVIEEPRAMFPFAIFPAAYAREAEEAVLVVFRGEAWVEAGAGAGAGAKRLLVRSGETFFAGRLGEGPVVTPVFLRRAGAELEALAAYAEELSRETARYRKVVSSYARDLAAKRKLRAAPKPDAGAELDELGLRIALVEEVKAAHERRLAEMAAEGPGAELRELERRVRIVREAERGHQDAIDRLWEF